MAGPLDPPNRPSDPLDAPALKKLIGPLVGRKGQPQRDPIEGEDPLEALSGQGDLGADMHWELERELRGYESGEKPDPGFLKRLDEVYKEWEAIPPDKYLDMWDRYDKATGNLPNV